MSNNADRKMNENYGGRTAVHGARKSRSTVIPVEGKFLANLYCKLVPIMRRCREIETCMECPTLDYIQVLGSPGKRGKGEIVLPNEIICEILIKLPMDQLLNCRAVCKSWNSMIKSSHFILSHLKFKLLIKSNNSKEKNEKDDLLLLHVQHRLGNPPPPSGGEIFTLDCDNINNEYTKSRRVIPISGIKVAVSSIYGVSEFNWEWFRPLGTCNGLICLAYGQERKDEVPILWNPCVRKIFVVPRPSFLPKGDKHYILGYDSHNKDFKVLQISELVNFVCTFRIFSLLGGSWKDLNAPADYKFRSVMALQIRDAFHWVCSEPLHKTNKNTAVVAFNLSTESFKQMKIPEALRKRPPRSCYTARYRESFALLSENKRNKRPWTVDLWVMNEYGVEESWTKVLKIRMTNFGGGFPVYFRNNGEIMLGTWCKGVEIFDRKRKVVKNIVEDCDLISIMDPFFESLVLLDRADAFSY